MTPEWLLVQSFLKHLLNRNPELLYSHQKWKQVFHCHCITDSRIGNSDWTLLLSVRVQQYWLSLCCGLFSVLVAPRGRNLPGSSPGRTAAAHPTVCGQFKETASWFPALDRPIASVEYSLGLFWNLPVWRLPCGQISPVLHSLRWRRPVLEDSPFV